MASSRGVGTRLSDDEAKTAVKVGKYYLLKDTKLPTYTDLFL